MTLRGEAKSVQAGTLALFVSDLHLQPSMPRTTQAFIDFLQRHAMRTKQLYLLGDLFEYWAGDDDLATPYHKAVIEAIHAVSVAGAAVFWIAGNRDFLAGAEFAQATGATRLPDPFVTIIGGQRLVLAHGDAQCTDDAAYMAFRAQVRQPDWQNAFLAMPLTKRKAIIEELRNHSRAAQRTKSYDIMDVNPGAIESLFDSTDASLMIHGHTHRPARHVHQTNGASRVRYVLPDWDCDVAPPRGGWIEICRDGTARRIGLDGKIIA
jgi:UDP-2,3-diacylglucosamine hydrolase